MPNRRNKLTRLSADYDCFLSNPCGNGDIAPPKLAVPNMNDYGAATKKGCDAFRATLTLLWFRDCYLMFDL
jgi:hypothetical protein